MNDSVFSFLGFSSFSTMISPQRIEFLFAMHEHRLTGVPMSPVPFGISSSGPERTQRHRLRRGEQAATATAAADSPLPALSVAAFGGLARFVPTLWLVG